ncbi:MAG TPA: FHA domain-containing protein [Mycobacteriales bacterium]|nr:FHA domain-containing protein [Mycobacteriales bacterium]
MFCTRCGHQNPDGSRYCAHCGNLLTEPGGSEATSVINVGALEEAPEQPEVPVESQLGAVDALPAGSALLVVKRGPNAGSRFLLDRETTTAGRHPDSDIFLDDVTVSRRHAEFRREAGVFSVHDVGSLNGTYVNRERIESTALAGGDEVQIGKFRLVFLVGSRTPSGGLGARTVGEDAHPGEASR